MIIHQLSKAEAVDIVLKTQLLNTKPKIGSGNNKFSADKLLFSEIIDKLGYIQIDTISVINRAHHHVLWSRDCNYKEKHLHDLQTKDKLVFEYWTHAMSYIPIKDYRFSLHRMKNFYTPKSQWLKCRYEQSKKYFTPILEKIKDEGMLSSGSFENAEGQKAGNWWQWKPIKTALEYLFWRGDLMVAERRGFQKYYDLTERVLLDNIDTTLPSEKELNRFFILKALSSMGVATEKEIQKFMQPGKNIISDLQVTERKTTQKTINEMCENGELVQVVIEGDKKSINFSLSNSLKIVDTKKSFVDKIHIISPFDNLIIQRDRTKRLFDFEYTIECYVPESKRKYGYFVLPIIWNNKFVARMDCKADRKSRTLLIKNIVFENKFKEFENFVPHFNKQLKNFSEFNNCDKIMLDKCTPSKAKRFLQ